MKNIKIRILFWTECIMWNWIKKIATAVVAVAVVTAVVATGVLGVALIPTVIACTAIGAATGAVAGAVIEGVDAKCKGESFWNGAGKGAIQGAVMGAAVGFGAGVAAEAAVAGGVGATVTNIGYALGAGSNAAVAGIATVTALGGLAGLGVGAAGVAAYEHISNQTSNQNQQNANQKQEADEALTRANKLRDESKDAALTKTQKLDKLVEADKFYKLFKGFYGIRDQDKKFFQDFDKTLTSLKQEKAGADEALEKANALKTQGDSSVTKAEKLSKLRDAVTEYTKYTAFYGTNNEAGCTKTALEAQIRILTSEQQKALELINIGNELCHAGEYLKAIKEYDKAIAFSDSAICHLYKAKALISLGNHQEAIDELDLVLEIDPSNIKAKEQKVLAYTAKAKVENENEDYSEAIKSADAALNIDHDNSDAKSQKIHSYIAQVVIAKNSKDYTKVCSLLKTAILIDENHDQIQVIKRILESSRNFLVLQQENLSLHEKISKEKEKHAQLRDDIDAIKVKQSDIGIDKQFDIDNDFITRDILMTVYGQENKSPFTISLSGESAEEVDISNS